MKSELEVRLIFLGVLIAILFILRCINASGWNDGHCSCGGRWVFQNAVGHRYETTFVYQCDKCGKIEEFYHKYAEVKE